MTVKEEDVLLTCPECHTLYPLSHYALPDRVVCLACTVGKARRKIEDQRENRINDSLERCWEKNR